MTATPPAGSPAASLVVDWLAIDDEGDSITVAGPLAAGRPAEVHLVGSRLTLSATARADGDRWVASVPLLASRWKGPLLPAPSGDYALCLCAHDGTQAPVRFEVTENSEQLVPGRFRVAVSTRESAASIVLSAPLADDERGPGNQRRLEAKYRATRFAPLNAVFFESFYGQNASCNPLAIDRAIAEQRPDVARYWSVVDASVEVPAGAVAIIEGSSEWWRIRGAARLLVVNDWLRKRYRRRRHQTVLQTWHGTMLKKIALNRPGVGLRTMAATILERARWNILLSQNPHSTRVLRSAYRFFGPVWEEGYPRDDILVTGDAAVVRDQLGIPADVTVLLYAPTWRDDRVGHIDHLDVAAFTDALGPGYLTLIRGHSRTLRPGRDLQGHNVMDVTGYPDISRLFLVADILITDYSSVMFDFSVTGKPLYFFTPDLEHYREQLRGFYFDLTDDAPGPVVDSTERLVRLVTERETVEEAYADRYAAWRARFNPRDDGHASDRVVARLIAEGVID